MHDKSPHKTPVVFLLGAGASKDAGIPVSSELTRKLEESLEEDYPSLLPVLRFIEGAIQFGKSCRGECLKDPINIEEVLTAAQFLSNRRQSYVYPFVSAWHEQVLQSHSLSDDTREEDKKALRIIDSMSSCSVMNSFDLLFQVCTRKLKDWLAIRDKSRVKYLRSLSDIVKAGYFLHIFTLNYDECVEQALSDTLGTDDSKWTNGFSETGWTPQLLTQDYHKFAAIVYKLHGSLDWVRDERLGICSLRWPPGAETEEIPEETVQPLIIFGTTDKLQPLDPFLPLLFLFQQRLLEADVIVIVGYSFGDSHINAMLLDALQADPKKRCIVCNPIRVGELLPESFQLFRRRFTGLDCGARQALEEDMILHEIEKAFEDVAGELPFTS